MFSDCTSKTRGCTIPERIDTAWQGLVTATAADWSTPGPRAYFWRPGVRQGATQQTSGQVNWVSPWRAVIKPLVDYEWRVTIVVTRMSYVAPGEVNPTRGRFFKDNTLYSGYEDILETFDLVSEGCMITLLCSASERAVVVSCRRKRKPEAGTTHSSFHMASILIIIDGELNRRPFHSLNDIFLNTKVTE